MRDSSRQRMQWIVVAVLFALSIGSIAAWANPVSTSTRVMLFSPSTGQWTLASFGQAKPGNEFLFSDRLYRVADSGKAEVVPNVDTGKLFEADVQFSKTSRRPLSSDVVQVLDKEMRFVEHALLATVQPGAIVRFQGRAYSVRADSTLANTGVTFSSEAGTIQRIEITTSGMQHVIDRHTVGETIKVGKSTFSPGENIQTLIRYAQLTAPVLESNGYLSRKFDAGRTIGIDGYKGKQTSTYRVITTQSGKLVTAYPILP